MSQAPFGALICDDYGVRCDCCGRLVRSTRKSIWHGSHQVCLACFAVWYDSAWTTAADIKRQVLEAEAAGAFPFGGNHSNGAERVPE